MNIYTCTGTKIIINRFGLLNIRKFVVIVHKVQPLTGNGDLDDRKIDVTVLVLYYVGSLGTTYSIVKLCY